MTIFLVEHLREVDDHSFIVKAFCDEQKANEFIVERKQREYQTLVTQWENNSELQECINHPKRLVWFRLLKYIARLSSRHFGPMPCQRDKVREYGNALKNLFFSKYPDAVCFKKTGYWCDVKKPTMENVGEYYITETELVVQTYYLVETGTCLFNTSTYTQVRGVFFSPGEALAKGIELANKLSLSETSWETKDGRTLIKCGNLTHDFEIELKKHGE